MTVTHTRIQHGVGQGSFHSASLEVSELGRRYRFDYVYDCGAGANQPTKALTRCIKRLDLVSRVGEVSTKSYLDLLVLSHFDQDHINGVEQLAKQCTIGRMVVPYVGIEELSLLIASQAVEVKTIQVLHEFLHGEKRLWGIPVTMIKTGSRGEENFESTEFPPEIVNEIAVDFDTPHKMTIVAAGSGKELGQEHEDGKDIHIDSMAGLAKWKLRFWNRGLDKKILEAVENRLKSIGFPFGMVASKNSIDGLIDWVKENKPKLHCAYREAIKDCHSDWAVSTGNLPNFISVGMYSGPSFRFTGIKTKYWRIASSEAVFWPYEWRYRARRFLARAGWLGTGDAPLGESSYWNDFNAHYKNELPRASTILIPHHGAASASGPRSFNPGLIHKPGVVAVISFGTNNTYGHPKTSVLEQIFSKDGDIQCVTENTVPGFCEFFGFE